MAKVKKEEPKTKYLSAVCGLGVNVEIANKWDAQGYDIQFCFAVVADDSEGKPTQCVYMLGKRRD